MRLAYLHLPRFPLQRRVLEAPQLAHRPLVLWVEERGAQRVVFASAAAFKAGVRPGMTVASATALVPALEKLCHTPQDEARALLSLGESLLPLAPGFEVHAPTGLWLDASASSLSRGEGPWAFAVRAAAAERGYVGRVAVASERFTALALARFAQGGHIAPPRAAELLAPLPLDALEVPGQLGEGGAAPFRSLGLSTLGEVAALPAGAVVARYGSLGLYAQRLARGEDDTRFTADPLPEALQESVPMEWAAESLEPLLFAVKAAVDRLCARLSGRKLAAVKLLLHLELDPAGHAQLPLLLARPSAESKKLLELFRHRLQELSLPRPVTGLKLEVVDACDDPGRQLVLGDGPSGDADLELVLSKLQSALGEDALFAASLAERHRPEAGWEKSGFHPPVDRSHFEGNRRPELPPIPAALKERPSRLLQRPVPLEVQLSDGGGLLQARVLGRNRKVTQVFGPERLCGDWWGPSAYSRDYYRVQFEGVGALWVFRDGKDGRFYLQGLFD